jgi:hypothetical protein
MKILLNTFFIVLTGVSGITQSINVDPTFIISDNFTHKPDSREPKINFSKKEKEIIQSTITNIISKGSIFYEGYIFSNNIFDKNGGIDTLSEFYDRTITSKNKIFKKDSVLFELQVPNFDANGERLYDDDGDEIYIAKDIYRSFTNSIHKMNTKEIWKYENEKLTKSISACGIDIKSKTDDPNWLKNQSYFSNSISASDFILLKRNINYTHFFYPQYYKIYLNNDTIWKSQYSEYLEIGAKASAENNQFEIVKLLQPIFDDIHLNKLKLFQIDSNQNITSNKIKAKKIIDLFRIIQTHEIDEDGELIYDDDGDEIYLTTMDYINPNDILGIEFYEDWYIGKDNFQLKKKIKGIVLISAEFNLDGILSGMKKIPVYISFE